MFSGFMNAGSGSDPVMAEKNWFVACLVPMKRAEERLEFGRWRLQPRQLIGEVIQGFDPLVAARLILGERLLECATLGETGIERFGQVLSVDEGVADPLRRDRVLLVAGVADERPARAVGLAEVIRDAGGSDPFLLAFRLFSRSATLGAGLVDLMTFPFDVRTYLLELLARPDGGDERQAVVGREKAAPGTESPTYCSMSSASNPL